MKKLQILLIIICFCGFTLAQLTRSQADQGTCTYSCPDIYYGGLKGESTYYLQKSYEFISSCGGILGNNKPVLIPGVIPVCYQNVLDDPRLRFGLDKVKSISTGKILFQLVEKKGDEIGKEQFEYIKTNFLWNLRRKIHYLLFMVLFSLR